MVNDLNILYSFLIYEDYFITMKKVSNNTQGMLLQENNQRHGAELQPDVNRHSYSFTTQLIIFL